MRECGPPYPARPVPVTQGHQEHLWSLPGSAPRRVPAPSVPGEVAARQRHQRVACGNRPVLGPRVGTHPRPPPGLTQVVLPTELVLRCRPRPNTQHACRLGMVPGRPAPRFPGLGDRVARRDVTPAPAPRRSTRLCGWALASNPRARTLPALARPRKCQKLDPSGRTVIIRSPTVW